MKKKILMLGSILLLLGSYFWITQFQESNFTVFNSISENKIEKLQQTLQKKEELDFTALLCNEIRVPFDDTTNTFFVPLNMEEENWEKMEFVSGQTEYSVLFTEDVTSYQKTEVIAEGKQFDLIVYDQNSWSNYNVVFSGLPIIDLTTDEHEGFYATEEITGIATFYNVDFAIHGTVQSDYNGHIRGNTSRMFPKKGYKINLTRVDEYGETVQNKISVFDMRKDEDWILYAMYNDDTKLRDALSMKVWDQIGAKAVSETAYYGTRMTYVEVFADNIYCGMYGLMEPIDGKQLDLEEKDYSYKRKNPGGLRYKYDNFSECTNPYEIIEGFEIKDGIMDESAWHPIAWLSDFLTLPEAEMLERKQDVINEDGLLRMWLFLQIITGHDHTAKNIFYVAKYDDDLKRNYQFYFAPWDMDLTWGNVSVGEVNPYYTDFEMNTLDDRVYWETADWMLDTNYHDAHGQVEKMYHDLRKTVLSDESVANMIEELDDHIRNSGAFERDRQRWPEGTHAADCSLLLKYAKERLNYLDIAIYDFDYFQ